MKINQPIGQLEKQKPYFRLIGPPPFWKLVAGGNFEPKQNIVQLLISSGQFMGASHEDPQVHLQNFLEICETFSPSGVSTDNIRLTLFPFSLLGEDKKWLNIELASSITIQDDLTQKFLIQFFPSGRTAGLHSKIMCFNESQIRIYIMLWSTSKLCFETFYIISSPMRYYLTLLLTNLTIAQNFPRLSYR